MILKVVQDSQTNHGETLREYNKKVGLLPKRRIYLDKEVDRDVDYDEIWSNKDVDGAEKNEVDGLVTES